jgi:titin
LWIESVTLTVFLSLDKPSKPLDLKPKEVTETAVTLTWSPPEDDGGAEITGYVLERREVNKRTWTKVTKLAELEFNDEGLTTGINYVYRVAAENEVGVGEFFEMDKAVTPKSAFG